MSGGEIRGVPASPEIRHVVGFDSGSMASEFGVNCMFVHIRRQSLKRDAHGAAMFRKEQNGHIGLDVPNVITQA